MSGRRGRVGVGATGVALTALVGEWLAHTLEYLRLSGVRGAFGSVHLFMGPAGAVLVVAALAGAHSTARLARVLRCRLAELRGIERRGRSGAAPGGAPSGSGTLSMPALAATLWVAQSGLYLVQENLEPGLAHRHAPGLAAMAGAHALVPVVHLAVALALVAGLWAARRQVTRLVLVVRLTEQRLRSVRRINTAPWPPGPVRVWTPIDRWGNQLCSRPPPAVRPA